MQCSSLPTRYSLWLVSLTLLGSGNVSESQTLVAGRLTVFLFLVLPNIGGQYVLARLQTATYVDYAASLQYFTRILLISHDHGHHQSNSRFASQQKRVPAITLSQPA